MADKLNITRRDFLNGMALSLAAGTSLSPLELLAQQSAGNHYPPALTGLRGSHAGSFEIAHAVALAGAKFDKPGAQTDATYDLVVVGGGISGLAAAHFYQQQRGGKVLVLDNHDDFGGHAKRNEFRVDGRTLIGYGGGETIQSPSLYSRESRQLLEDVGIDLQRFYEFFDRRWGRKHGVSRAGIYFSREAYGRDVTAESAMWIYGSGPDYSRIEDVVAQYPIADESKAALVRLMLSEDDYLPDLDHDEKVEVLARISYSDFLRKYVGVPEEVVTLQRDSEIDNWGIGFDAVSALEAYRGEYPGTWGLDLALDEDPDPYEGDDPYIFHFPDGLAGLARALVRKLVPDALPGKTMEDLVTARLDYGRIDSEGAATRIRLSATAVDVRHAPDQAHVDVTYVRNGSPELVRGRHVVLACYNRTIPYICSEVGEQQKAALLYGTKTPMVYSSIAVRNWRPFAALGMGWLYIPRGILMNAVGLDFPVSMGNYRFTQDPGEPTILHGVYVATLPDQGLSVREQNLAGRKRILEMSFDDFESRTVRQLEGALGGAGFDAERDIAGITVNRWPHGYTYGYSELFDPWEYGYDNGPHVTGRQRIGRISIANSDSHAVAYANAAVDAAHRAVAEQLEL